MRLAVPRTLRALTVTAVLVAAAPSVRAQEGKALAEALFRDGRELMADGKVHEACSKFAMSQRIEPKLGTLLNLASCNEADGKIASAWAQFTEARAIAERTGQAEREQFAREHADALSTRLSRITVASADGSELSLQLDGVMIDAAVVLLWLEGRLPWIALAIVIARDLVLVGGSRFAVRRGYTFEVSFLGKAATWILYASLFFVLATPDGTDWPLWIFWTGLGLAVVAGVQYVAAVLRTVR